MKKSVIILFWLAAALAFPTDYTSAHPRGQVSFGVFYDGLSPYGEWVGISAGVYGWRPTRVDAGWRPYTVGRWCWTDDGWFWLSDEPWGWAAYHYGRWYYDDYYGWIWIPGYDWAPAWVEWRYGSDYVGWAPLSPYAVFSVSWGIHYRTRWYTPVNWWTFVGCGYINSPNLHRYVYRTENNSRYIGVTRTGGSVRSSGGRIVTRGPDREYVERRGNIRLETVGLRDVDERGAARIVRNSNADEIEVYRPRIDERRGDQDGVDRPANVREERGRSVDLDTRKIDVRAREVAREEGRDMKRADEYGTRSGSGWRDGNRQRDDGMLKGPVDDAIRNRESSGRSSGIERRRDPSESGDTERGRRDIDRPQRQPDVRSDRGRPAEPQREPRERKREETSSPRDYRSPAPERRMEMPRSEPPRSAGGERSGGGRNGRGR